ncbi:MAG TPA: hypothetical protein VFM21_06300, partial [Terriglobia bacterium]|nr:hypothetical protein [Terriglobia bacterium]
MRSRLKEDAGIILFVLLLAGLIRIVWFNTFYNWDVLPYAALVNEPLSDPVRLQASAYAAADAEAPREAALDLRGGPINQRYRADMASDPWHFAEQLPLYSVKPLYILVLAGIHHLGAGTFNAARLISLLSFVFFGTILFLWMRPYTGGLLAAVGSCFLLSTAEILGCGAQTTPDALFSVLALAGLYFIFARKQFFWGWGLLALVPLVRTDGLVLMALVLALLAWRSPEFPKRYGLAIVGAEILASLVMGWLGGGYGFQTLFYHSFVERLVAPAEATVRVTMAEYFRALHIFVLGSLATPRPLYFLLGLISLRARGTPPVLQGMAWLGLAFAVVHIVLFPLPDSRFLMLPFALIVLWAAGSLAA